MGASNRCTRAAPFLDSSCPPRLQSSVFSRNSPQPFGRRNHRIPGFSCPALCSLLDNLLNQLANAERTRLIPKWAKAAAARPCIPMSVSRRLSPDVERVTASIGSYTAFDGPAAGPSLMGVAGLQASSVAHPAPVGSIPTTSTDLPPPSTRGGSGTSKYPNQPGVHTRARWGTRPFPI